MGVSVLTLGIPIVAFVFVAFFQIKNWKRSRDISGKIGRILREDIDHLYSHAGWAIVMDHFDRLLEAPLDEIRRLANAALVTGIGGTMGIFLIKVLFIREYISEFQDGLSLAMMVGVGIALLSSLIGVMLHLYIVSILGKAQDLVSEKEKELFSKISGPKPPDPLPQGLEKSGIKFLDTALNFLEGQRATTSKIEVYLRGQNTIDQKVSEYLDALREQSRMGDRILLYLEGVMREMEVSQENLLRKIQNLFSDQSEYANEIEQNVGQLTKELKALPQGITRALDMSDKFEKQAGTHIRNLHDIFQEHKNFLTTEIVSNQHEVKRLMTSHLETALKEAVAVVQKPVGEKIVGPLDTVSRRLNHTSQEMNKAATDLEQLMKEMPEVARKFCADIEESANTFSNTSQELKSAVLSIQETVNETTSESIQPIYDDMKDFMATVRDTHGKLERVVQGLVKLIKDLINGIKEKR